MSRRNITTDGATAATLHLAEVGGKNVEVAGAPTDAVAIEWLSPTRVLIVRGREGTSTAQAFTAWQQKLAGALRAGGLADGDAEAAAALLLAASEGAVVICRAQQDVRYFDTVAAQLLNHVRGLTAGGGRG